ncbi:MAG TPA: V-type ATP synthase subunit I, partial [Candidatus Atribacteria bacterium]|nr:V-type ATP synthase subunit I [Candidatus Atribacteria bacterium]
EKIIKEVQSLLIYKDKLEVIFDYLSILKEREDVKKELFWTKKVLLIEGWVLEPDVEKLKKELKSIGSQIEILVFDPPEGETPPIELDNKRYVKPFEIITKLYSYPNHREPDPTPFVALFFFVFFGMCLTDAGYGIVMAVLFYLAVKKFKIGSGAKLFFKLLMYGGVATIFAGALTGSWFGNSIDLLPQSFGFLKSIKNFIMITDPMKNPIPMLAFSLLLGLIQIFTGLFIEFYSNIKAGKVKDAWMDQGSWIFFLVAILIAIGGLPFAKYLVMIGALIIVLTQGRHNKNILAKIGGGVLSLYDVVGYLGDTLSYSRLFALGLTTAAIAMIVNTIMELLSGTPIIGFLIGAVIFVFGHIFNLVINALGAFIHSARLQYVEFFTKFYEGGGLPFSPFKLKTQYVKIKNL